MNRFSLHRPQLFRLATLLCCTAKAIRRSSTRSSSPPDLAKTNLILTKSKPNRRQLISILPSICVTQNPKSPNFISTEYRKLYDILSNQDLKPGPELENALNGAEIDPDEALLLEIFNHFDSSPKPLITLFHWAEKQPGYQFSVALFNAMINALGRARKFDSAWSLILDNIEASKMPNIDTFAIMIRRYTRAGMLSSLHLSFGISIPIFVYT